MERRKICVVVTARPSYSRIKTALQAIKEHPKLELQLVVAASALLDRYGSAVQYIEKDGFHIAAKVFNVLEGENLTAAAKTTGLGIMELSSVFANLDPDIVVTVADRFETMSTAIAASYMNIPLAHIQGGEVTGNIDEKVRHAITKLSDYHFVASEDAKERVLNLGENPEFVFNTGCPSIDIAKVVLEDNNQLFDVFGKYVGSGKKLSLKDGYVVVMQHPVTTEYNESRRHIDTTLEALSEIDKPILWFWPNVDAGADGTSKGIRVFREVKDASNFHFFKNMEPNDFLKLLKYADCLIGNSSVGIRECAYIGVPVVNIGTRQAGRQRAGNVVDCDYIKEQIFEAINMQMLHGKYPSDNVYGSGKSGSKIAQLLADVPLQFDKKITY
jgi:UDP-hydrolysing UDP-N-acetyl-D-glucosamine 2-epimerase